MDRRLKGLNKTILDLQRELKAYEQAYQQSSADFYAEFSQGHVDDREAYVLWAGLYEMLKKNQRRLEDLQR